MRLKVSGHPNLYKDTESGIVIQESSADRERYRLARQNAIKQLSLHDEVAILKNDISDMKNNIDMILKLLTINSK